MKDMKIVRWDALVGVVTLVVLAGAAVGKEPAGEASEQQPKIISTVKPDYPFAMRRAGIQGRVLVQFVVDSKGRVRIPYVTESTHPGFRDAAIEAVRKWKFRPGKRNGERVNTRMQVPIMFSIKGQPTNWGWQIKRPKKFPDSIPPEMRWDTPPELRSFNPPIYPRQALMDGREGRVEVGFLVGPNGTVLKAEPIEGKHEDLVGASIAAVYTFLFDPSLREGQPCGALLNMTFDFKMSSSGDALYTPEMSRLLDALENDPECFHPLDQLDQMPQPLYRRAPVQPPLMELDEAVTVKVDFIINRRGAAELPVARGEIDPLLAFAATQAVSSWQFIPPMIDGEVVDARAVVPIVFQPAKSD